MHAQCSPFQIPWQLIIGHEGRQKDLEDFQLETLATDLFFAATYLWKDYVMFSALRRSSASTGVLSSRALLNLGGD